MVSKKVRYVVWQAESQNWETIMVKKTIRLKIKEGPVIKKEIKKQMQGNILRTFP